MVTYTEVYTAAQVAVDANLADDKIWQKSSRPRRLVKIGFSGSTDETDCAFDIMVGSEKIGHIVNTGLTTEAWTKVGQFWHSGKLHIPAGAPISLIVTDAADTNACYLFLDFQELTP